MENNPIGIFDTGIGGSSILASCVAQMPHESFIYVADNKKAPYGKRFRSTIYKRVRKILIDLIECHQIKAFVIACNTASSVCKQKLRNEFAIPIIAVEPPLKLVKREENCLILATKHTLKCKRVRHFMKRKNVAYKIAISSLAARIDKNIGNFDEILPFLRKKLASFAKEDKNISAVVLGCTHYSFIEKQLQQVFPNASIISSEKAVARQVKNTLREVNLLCRKKGGTLKIILTKPSDKMENFINEIYAAQLDNDAL